MQASDALRVVAANLGEGDEVPMAVLPAAIPYFLVRLTAICVERRELGVLHEFILRGIQTGLSDPQDIAGFLGIQTATIELEIDQLLNDFFIGKQGTPAKLSLMEKGIRAISASGLTRIQLREIGCYVHGATRRIEATPGDLLPRRRLPAGTLTLPAVPARPPRIDELDVNGVKAGISSRRESMPRIIEIARLGQVLRTHSLFLPGHILFRRGVHGVPLVCADGSADADIAHSIGSHPTLQSVKTALERHETQAKRTLSQHRTELRAIGFARPSSVRTALTAFVAYCDARTSVASVAEEEFIRAADELRTKSHWIGASEAQILLARAVLLARQRIVIVAPPQSSSLFGATALESLAVAARRGTKLVLHVSSTDPRFSLDDEVLKPYAKDIEIAPTSNDGNWCGFCCDELFAVIGATKVGISTIGRYEAFFGALVANAQRLPELLHDVAIRSTVPVIQRQKRKKTERPPPQSCVDDG